MAMVVALEIGSFFLFSSRVIQDFLNVLNTLYVPSNTDCKFHHYHNHAYTTLTLVLVVCINNNCCTDINMILSGF